MQAIDNYIDQVRTLPPAPRVLLELLFLLSQENVDSQRIVELVTFDPALAAKVLQRCNQVSSGSRHPVADLNQAVVRLGFNELYRLTAGVIGENTLIPAQRGYGLAAGELWQHSAVTATAGRVIARELGWDENLVFTAALLHDIGKLVLSASVERVYATVVKEIATSGLSFLEAEKAILGVEHTEVGGRLLSRWNFPEGLVSAVWHHHHPAMARPYEHLAACVYVADLVSHIIGHGPGHQSFAVRIQTEVMELLEINARDIEKFVLLTSEELLKATWFTPAQS